MFYLGIYRVLRHVVRLRVAQVTLTCVDRASRRVVLGQLLVGVLVHVDVLDEVVVVENQLAEVQLLSLLLARGLLDVVHVFFIRVVVFLHADVPVSALDFFEAVVTLLLVGCGVEFDAFDRSLAVVRALLAAGHPDELDVFVGHHAQVRINVFVLEVVVLVILEMRISPTRILVLAGVERVVLSHGTGSLPSVVGIHGVHRHGVVEGALASAYDATRRVRDQDGRLLGIRKLLLLGTFAVDALADQAADVAPCEVVLAVGEHVEAALLAVHLFLLGFEAQLLGVRHLDPLDQRVEELLPDLDLQHVLTRLDSAFDFGETPHLLQGKPHLKILDTVFYS